VHFVDHCHSHTSQEQEFAMIMKVMLLREDAKVPKRDSVASAGWDVFACLPDVEGELTIEPHSRQLVPTAIAIEIEHGYFANLASRSGLAASEFKC
jgi:dUTP pyrophosphatase